MQRATQPYFVIESHQPRIFCDFPTLWVGTWLQTLAAETAELTALKAKTERFPASPICRAFLEVIMAQRESVDE